MKKIKIIAIVLLLIFPSALVCPSASAASIKWKLQTTGPSGSIIVEKFAKIFAKLVKEKSDGRLVIKVYPASAIIPPLEVTTAVGKGIIEMGLGGPVYDVGSIPLAYVAGGLPFAWATPEDQYEFWNLYKGGKALELLNRPYHEKGVHNIILATFDDEYVAMTNFPVNTLEDWRGKKMRATGIYGKVMAELGAATVNMSLPEVYMGIQTGTIDGAVAGISLLEEFKLKEVVRYVIRPAFSSCVGTTLYVNLDKWNRLPDDLKDIVNAAAHNAYANSLMPYSLELKKKTMNDAIRKNDIKIINLSEKETQRLMEAVKPVWDYVGGLSSANAELLDLVKAYLNEKGTPYPGK